MILYLDTSALVKRYFIEPYSDDVLTKCKASESIVTSCVAYAETLATIHRKKKESSLKREAVRKIVRAFQADWDTFIRVEVTDDLNETIEKVIQKQSLRGFDAVHLASALVIHERLPQSFFFACFDRRLNQAAQMEGLETF